MTAREFSLNKKQTSVSVEFLDWDEFMSVFRWDQGQHVSVCAPTGVGKTVLMQALLPLRQYVAMFGVKPKDQNLTRMSRKKGGIYTDTLKLPTVRPGDNGAHALIWPRLSRPGETLSMPPSKKRGPSVAGA
jgi:hypothetical protein